MKNALKYIKLGFFILLGINIFTILAAVTLIVLSYFGIATVGLWFVIVLSVIGGIDLLSTVFALSFAELKSGF